MGPPGDRPHPNRLAEGEGASQNPILDKRSFYSQREIAEVYDQQRFSGASGQRVNARELAVVLDIVPPSGRVLDLASGTGRLAEALARRGQPVVAADYSAPMAERTHALGIPSVIGDAFAAPFRTGSFAAVVALRFAFHYSELAPLLAEMARLGAPGAAIVLDTYSWSPRSVIPIGARRWGGVVHLHPPAEVKRVARNTNLRVEQAHPCFLFSPYLYRLAPLAIERVFEWMERCVPKTFLCRTFWKLTTEVGLELRHDAAAL